eukprot:gb/GECH01011000.1/.p1 GENE.gb/GECH01011000.1/~~gb/GECH01011000.1/.p1  ORF type:complete len:1115 (+),score=185.06 gb/GECH01011000.1/:1-3345(+)
MLRFKFSLPNLISLSIYIILISLIIKCSTGLDVNCAPGSIDDCINDNIGETQLKIILEAGNYTLSGMDPSFEKLTIEGASSTPRTPEGRNDQEESFVTLTGTWNLETVDEFNLNLVTLDIADNVNTSLGKGLFNRNWDTKLDGVILEDIKGMTLVYQPSQNITRLSTVELLNGYYSFVNSEAFIYDDIVGDLENHNIRWRLSTLRFVNSTSYFGGLIGIQVDFVDIYLDSENWSISSPYSHSGAYMRYTNFYCSEDTKRVELLNKPGSQELIASEIHCPYTIWKIRDLIESNSFNVSRFYGEDISDFSDNKIWSSEQISGVPSSSNSLFDYDEPFESFDLDSVRDTFQFEDYAFSVQGDLKLDQPSLKPETEEWSLFHPEEIASKLILSNALIPPFHNLNASIVDAKDSCLDASNIDSQFKMDYNTIEQHFQNFFWIPPTDFDFSKSSTLETEDYSGLQCSCIDCIRMDSILEELSGTECKSITFQNECFFNGNSSCTVSFSVWVVDSIEIPELKQDQYLIPGENSIEWNNEYCPETELNAALVNKEKNTVKEFSASDSPLYFELNEDDGDQEMMIKLYYHQQTIGFSSSFEIAKLQIIELLGLTDRNRTSPGDQIEISYEAVPGEVSMFLEQVVPEETPIVVENKTLSLNDTGEIKIPKDLNTQSKYQIRLVNELGMEDISEIFTVTDEEPLDSSSNTESSNTWVIFDIYSNGCWRYDFTEAIPVGVCSPLGYRAECEPHNDTIPISLISCRDDTTDLEYEHNVCTDSDLHQRKQMKVHCIEGDPRPVSETHEKGELKGEIYGYPQGSDCNADPVYFASVFEAGAFKCWRSSYLTTDMKSSLEVGCSYSNDDVYAGVLPWDEECSFCGYRVRIAGCTSHPGLPFDLTGVCDDGLNHTESSSSSSSPSIPYSDLRISNETEWIVLDIYSDSACQVYQHTDAFRVGVCNPLGTTLQCYYAEDNYYPYVGACYPSPQATFLIAGQCTPFNYYSETVYVKTGCVSGDPKPLHKEYLTNTTAPQIYGYTSENCDSDPIYFTTSQSSECRETSYLSPFVTSSSLSCDDNNDAMVDTSLLSKDCSTCGAQQPVNECTDVSGVMNLYLKGTCTTPSENKKR